MNKKLLVSFALASLTGISTQAKEKMSSETTQQRPNIILFMVDDMGWQDTSLPFWTQKTHYNEAYETPNMERLAKKGMMFTQAYACNISSATRCSLITGANNTRHRVTNWTLEKNKATDRPSNTIELPDWNYNGVSQVTGTPNTFVGTSFVELLRQNGYHTIHCGKAHFGSIDTPGENPTHWGFEVNIAGHAAGGLATYLSEQNYGHTRDGKPYSLMAIPGLEDYWGTGIFATEALTQEAIKALDKAKKYNQPFYLYMAHYAIHVPVDKDMRFFPKYIKKGLSDKEAAYASLIEGMDKSLGDLMNWLEKNDEADNTVIIFMSDNGGLAAEPGWRDGQIHTQNAPLNSGKGSLYEGGIREPMIVSWPGVVTPDTRCDKYLIIEDFYPMLKELNKNINFTSDNNITIYADSDKLSRVFNNLIKNAINYSKENTNIDIKVKKKDKEIKVEIINQGKMIPKDKLDKIFENFYRLDTSRTSKTGGSGLGLAISKQIVELHNGKIEVTSNKDKTTFKVSLPLDME